MPYKNKEKRKKYADKYYKIYNKTEKRLAHFRSYKKIPKVRARLSECARVRHNKRKDELIDYFGRKCVDCGVIGSTCIYDFHHKDAKTKKQSVSSLLLYSWKSVLKEAKKCVLICANCHRIRHFNKKGKRV
jgi:hypothetical protein